MTSGWHSLKEGRVAVTYVNNKFLSVFSEFNKQREYGLLAGAMHLASMTSEEELQQVRRRSTSSGSGSRFFSKIVGGVIGSGGANDTAARDQLEQDNTSPPDRAVNLVKKLFV